MVKSIKKPTKVKKRKGKKKDRKYRTTKKKLLPRRSFKKKVKNQQRGGSQFSKQSMNTEQIETVAQQAAGEELPMNTDLPAAGLAPAPALPAEQAGGSAEEKSSTNMDPAEGPVEAYEEFLESSAGKDWSQH